VRVVVITRHGAPEVLQVQERPAPVPGPGQVLIEVAAAGVNFADTMARVGLYAPAPKPPAVVGYEVAGTIAAVGDGVDAARVGERVMAGTRFGGYAEQVVVGAGDATPLPDALSFAQGAAIPVNYATAWAALATLEPGERVLIHTAGGGVGIAATQLARRRGAHVLGTSSPGKLARLDLDERLDSGGLGPPTAGWRRLTPQSPAWWRGVNIEPVDLVLDAIGGRSFAHSYRLLRPGGRLVAFGASSVLPGERRSLARALPQALPMLRGFNLVRQMDESKTVIGLNMLTLWDDRGTLTPWIEPLRELLDDGTIRPVVAAEVPFAQAPEAHRILAERRNVGKVVLVP
jgi:NADPH:quinone reductase-like Zn-dependent oxidoreductase